MYTVIQFEIFYAFIEAMKIIQVIYIAKWINRRYFVLALGLLYLFEGIFSGWSKSFYYSYYDQKQDYKIYAYIQIASSIILFICAIL